MKGQVSFEALFVLLAVLTFTIFVGSQYTRTTDITNGLMIVRNELTAQTNSMKDNYLLTKVDLNYSDVTNKAVIIVLSNPNTLKPQDFNWVPLKNEMLRITTIKSFDVNVNGTYQVTPYP